MKRGVGWPGKAVSARKGNEGVVGDTNFIVRGGNEIEQPIVHDLVPKPGHLPVLAAAIAAEHQETARIVMTALGGRDRLIIGG